MRRIEPPEPQCKARSVPRSQRVRSGAALPLRILICSLILCGIGVSGAVAQEPEIRVAAGKDEIFVGENVDFHVEIRNSKNPSAPDLSTIKELFEVVANGDESRNQSSVMIVNGQVSQQSIFSHIYHYQLTPKQSGQQTIPSVKANINGKILASQPIPLNVIPPEEQDLVVVEIETSRERVFPTQPFTVTLRILLQPLPNSSKDPLTPLHQIPPHIQVNWVDPIPGLTTEEKIQWLQPLLSDDRVGFTLNDVALRTGSFFEGPRAAQFKLSKGRETRAGLDGTRIRYFNYELVRTFTPEKTGEYTFGPAFVKGTFVTGIERNQYASRQLVAISKPATVEVREVPSPRPSTFCGGIGDFRVAASASPTKLRVGDPLTLTLELERGANSGSLELVSAPDLSAIAELTADFDLIDKSPTGRVEGNVKKFAYAMRPRKANVGIPSLGISTFDPNSEQFVDASTQAIPLEVSEASRITAGDLVGSLPTTAPTEIKTLAKGIYQNIADPSEVRDEQIDVIAWAAATAGVWSLSGCVIAIVTLYRRKSSDVGWQRRRQARGAANRELANARRSQTQGQSKEALRHVRSALLGFIGDMRNRVIDGLTAADAAEALAAVFVPGELRDEVTHLLEALESAEYGGGQTTDPAKVIETGNALIRRIAPYLEKGA